MEIYIVRHGIAIDREDRKCPPDPERYLTEEGIEKTKRVAAAVAALGASPDLLLSSPYVRAMQTAEIFALALDYSKRRSGRRICCCRARTFVVVSRVGEGQTHFDAVCFRTRAAAG